jgi:hypothetical protein
MAWADERPGFGELRVNPVVSYGDVDNPDNITSLTYDLVPCDDGEVVQEESVEDWWYAHDNVYDPVTHEHIGYVAAGYSHIANWRATDPGGCFEFNAPEYTLQAGLLEDMHHRRSAPFGTIGLYDLKGNMVWCRLTLPGTFYSVMQAPDGSIIAAGEASANKTAFAPMNGHPMYYNPTGSGDLDISTIQCGNVQFPLNSFVLKPCMAKYDLAGNLLWANVYGPDVSLEEAWNVFGRGQDVVPVTIAGDAAYMLVGTGVMVAGEDVRGLVVAVRPDGTLIDQRYFGSVELPALGMGVDDAIDFYAADAIVTQGEQHVVISGVHRSTSPPRAILIELNMDDGDVWTPQWVRSTALAPIAGFHDQLKPQWTSGVRFAPEGSSANVLWPVMSDYNSGVTWSAGKWCTLKVHKFDPNGIPLWPAPAGLGEIRAFDMQSDLCPTADGNFAVIASAWAHPYSATQRFGPGNLSPDAAACLSQNYTYDQDPGPAEDHFVWTDPGYTEWDYWNTDAYVSKVNMADGSILWSTKFDAAPDQDRVCTPGDLKKQECMYKISEAPDGSLIVSGNTSHNRDDSYLAKLYPDCQSAVAYDPAISAAVLASSDHSYTVAANETWGTNKKVHGIIVIPDGHTLNINNNALIEFADSRLLDHPTRLIVEAGGRLNISADATLTSLPGCNGQGAMWDGIIVRGNLDHPLQEPLASSAQGYASVRNSRIENARVGISVGEDLLATNSMAEAQTRASGGIVIADNVFFSNNVRDVVFSPFENHHGDYPNGLYGIADNKSRFRRCTFENTATLNDPYERPQAHATLFGVRGVRFQGCTFTGGVYPMLDEFDNTVLTDQYMGQGIKSLNSTFAVEARCQPQQYGDPCTEAELVRNTFNTLWYGVNASTFGDMSRTFIVDRSDFAGCVKGIRMEGIQDAGITLNTFEVGDLPVGDLAVTPYGVYSDQCTGYEIEENRFSTDARFGSTPKVGLIIKDSGKYANTFYNNTFDGLYVGSLIEGNNANDGETVGLEVKCNDYGLETKCDFDVALTGDLVKIQKTQGTPILDQFDQAQWKNPAGNRFSLTHYGTFDTEEDWFVEDNLSTVAEYFQHTPTPGNRTLPAYRDQLNLFVTDQQVFWPSKEVACPSNLDREKSRDEKRSASITEDEAYNDGKDAYDAAKDNGDTYSLETYVSDPTKSSTQVRNALQSVSPNVSAEVWQAAFERSPAMSTWHITQALISNSPLQGEVLKLMYDSGLPAFYTSLVENAQNGEANILSLLESGMAYHAGQNAEALQSLGRESYLDSLDLDSGLDSLKWWHEGLPADNHGLAVGAVLAAKGDLAGLYDLAHSYVVAGDDPLLYGLVKYYTAGWPEADEATRAWVSDLGAQRGAMGSAQANAWREALGEGSVEEIILLPLEFRASRALPTIAYQPVEWAEEVVLEAYPNPTKGPVYIVFRTPIEVGQLELRVVDANGREAYRSSVVGGSGIVELHTAGWTSGLYVVELSSELMEPTRVKLSVLR